MTFLAALKRSRGDCTKAWRLYRKANKMTEVQWYYAWHHGLAAEVEAAINSIRASEVPSEGALVS